MKRKLKKKVRIIINSLLLLTIICGAIYISKDILSNSAITIKNKISSSKKNKKEEAWPKVSKLSLVATGDALLHNSVYKDGYNSSTGTFDYSHQFRLVKDIISSYDIAYYNQETLFGGKQEKVFTDATYQIPGYSSYPFFNSPSEYGDAMLEAGFNMVSLASNHSADCTWNSKECIVNAYNYWQSKDVVFDGFNPTIDKTNNYIIKEKNGIKYTMLNYTTTLNGLDGYIANDPYLVDTYDEVKVKQDIEEVRDKVDVLIVAMHWHTGAEYTFTPTEKNKQITEYLSSLGVDIVLGTYSHCLQPFDIVNDTVVFYSLGNFISNQNDLISSIGYKGIIGALASMDITKTLYEDGTSQITIDNIGADLIYTHEENKAASKGYVVVPFSKMTSDYASNYEQLYADYSAVLTSLNQNITIAPLGSNL
ncbi:MAG: CapA family protein [Firmicutes bacterium]|nr:CapA family protein [Bacillota bacterium]